MRRFKGEVWSGEEAKKRAYDLFTTEQLEALVKKKTRGPGRVVGDEAEQRLTKFYEMVSRCDWDTDITLHLDKRRRTGVYDDGGSVAADWAEKEVAQFWKHLDQMLFGNAAYRRKKHIKRFFSMEYAGEVGWHAHGVAILVDTGITKAMLADEWVKYQLRDQGSGNLRKLRQGLAQNAFTDRLALVRNYWEHTVYDDHGLYNNAAQNHYEGNETVTHHNNSKWYVIKSAVKEDNKVACSASYM